ncbi:unnamed protein product [Rotaria sp. Silwood2]|nr:unnamed protein product [Rotaria sp. Silwood2]CAF3084444.1 unnamed protein product [Rotaria sp. Silwood2]
MDLRDEAFYDFIRQFSWKKVAELLSFQECNGVDSFLGCEDVTAVLQLKSDQLNELKKNTCITLSDGSVVLLPGLESSIINLKKVLKKKREEINKQAERLHAINSSMSLATSSALIIPTQNFSSIFHPSTHTSPLSHASTLPDSLNVSSSNSRTTFNPLTDEITNRITRTIIDWLDKNKHELNLVNTNFKEGVDFRLELNKRQDGIMMICKCGSKNSIGQKQGILVFSNIYRHFKSGKCLLMTENKQNLIDNDGTSNNEQSQTQPTLSISRQSKSI